MTAIVRLVIFIWFPRNSHCQLVLLAWARPSFNHLFFPLSFSGLCQTTSKTLSSIQWQRSFSALYTCGFLFGCSASFGFYSNFTPLINFYWIIIHQHFYIFNRTTGLLCINDPLFLLFWAVLKTSISAITAENLPFHICTKAIKGVTQYLARGYRIILTHLPLFINK